MCGTTVPHMPKAIEVPLKGTTKKSESETPLWIDRDPVQQAFLMKRMKRITYIKQKSAEHYPEIRESIMLYEGKSTIVDEKKDERTIETVMPIARAFVEAKTAEEVKSMNEYEYTPVKDTADSWKVGLISDVNKHVHRVVKRKSKRHKMIR